MLVSLVVLIFMAVAVGIGYTVGHDNDRPMMLNSSQSQAIDNGCQSWFEVEQGDNSPGRDWCSKMAVWMGRHMDSAHLKMNPLSASQLRTGCRRWVSEYGAAEGALATMCDDMTEWMSHHARSDWGRSMMR